MPWGRHRLLTFTNEFVTFVGTAVVLATPFEAVFRTSKGLLNGLQGSYKAATNRSH